MFIVKLKQKLSDRFVRNVGWMGGAELVNRVFRLGTTVILARLLSPQDYGLAAIVLTVKEIAFVFTLKSGISNKLVQADDKDLEILSNTAFWINCILCIFLFLFQCLAAFAIAWFYQDNRIILPVCIIALEHLLMPSYAIQTCLILRENRLNIIALGNVLQSMANNIITMIFALMGFGLWAIVLPILLGSPLVWIFIARKYHSWRPKKTFTLERWQEIVNFGKNVLGIDLLDKLRSNLDYLIIGRFLGVEALGLYFFAFNAGLGISLNLINVMMWSLFPYLCAVRNNWEQFRSKYFSSIKTIALVIIPLVILQSSLAPFYVPLVFGDRWVAGIPILMLICLSAIPRPFEKAASSLMLAIDKTDIDLKWNVFFTLIFSLAIVCVVKQGVLAVAITVLLVHLIAMPIYTIWATRYVFASKKLL
jgi:O-antigen/teichoic acid export membrane protein